MWMLSILYIQQFFIKDNLPVLPDMYFLMQHLYFYQKIKYIYIFQVYWVITTLHKN